MPIAEEHRRLLDERGWIKLDGFIPPALRARLVARRLANLADKGAAFVECMLEPRVLEHVAHVLGPRFKPSSLNARSASPGSTIRQTTP